MPNQFKQLEQRFQSLIESRAEWNDERTDVLLEAFLAGHKFFSSDVDRSMLHRTGRTYSSIEHRLRRVATLDHQARTYTPVNRSDRSAMDWTQEDWQLVYWATSEEGIANRAASFGWLSVVLGRHPVLIQEEFDKYRRKTLLGFTQSERDYWTAIHEVAKRNRRV